MKKKIAKNVFLFLVLILTVVFVIPFDATAASISLNKSAASVTVGKSLTLKAALSEISGTVTWTSSKKSVASVSSKGVVTAKKAGKTIITATVGDISAKCVVTVKEASVDVTDEYKKSVTKLLKNFEGYLCYAPEEFVYNNYTKTSLLCYMNFDDVERKSVSAVKKILARKMKLYFGGTKSNIKFYDISAVVTLGNYPYVFRTKDNKVFYIGGDYGEDIPVGKITKVMKSGSTYTVTYKAYLTSEYSSEKTYLGAYKIKLKEASNKYGFIITNITFKG